MTEPTEESDSGLANARRWLLEQGYPLEFATARILRGAGFDARQGRFYEAVAPEGVRVREIDVLAHLRPLDPAVAVALVAECKRTSKPWIVLTGEAMLSPTEVLNATVASASARALLVALASRPGVKGGPPFFELPTRHGFAVVEAYRPPNQKVGAADDAMAQVVDAAQSGGLAPEPSFYERDAWSFAWAVIVIDGQLFETTNDDGTELQEVDRARILWYGATAERAVLVDIVRSRHLSTYAAEAHSGLRAIQDLLSEEAQRRRQSKTR